MLKCLQLEEIENRLLEVPALADSYERRDSDFPDMLIAWLTRLEKTFEENRMAAAGNVAAKRAMFLSASRGVIPEGINVHGRVTRKKLRDAAAINALDAATAIAENSIVADRERHRQANEICRRIVAVAAAKRLKGYGAACHDCSDKERWTSICSDKDTHGGVIQLEGLVGRTDTLILLNRLASGA